MVELKKAWSKFRDTRSGWAVIVTIFALTFGLVAVIISGVLGIPWLMNESSPNADLALGIIFPIVVLCLTLLTAKYISNKRGASFSKSLGWSRPKKNAIWLIPSVLFGYILVLIISLTILQMFSPELAKQEQDVAGTVSSLGGWRLLLMVLSVGILTPVAEETFFRGLLMSTYAKKLKMPLAILFSASLFAFAHAQVNIGIDTFFFGLGLGLLAWKTESIYPSVGLHVLKNSLALGLILNWKFF